MARKSKRRSVYQALRLLGACYTGAGRYYGLTATQALKKACKNKELDSLVRLARKPNYTGPDCRGRYCYCNGGKAGLRDPRVKYAVAEVRRVMRGGSPAK